MKNLKQEIKLFFRQTLLITNKDFKSLFVSPLFFVWAGVSFVFLSYIFPRDLFRFAMSYAMPAFGGGNQERNIHFDVFVAHISYMNLILLLSIPVLGMKLLAEEKQNRTFDLLMTSPLSSLQMILGKYFALLLLVSVFLLCSLFYPLSTAFFTEIPLGPLFSSYLGLFLVVALYSAIALFASSLTSSLFLSAFIGTILNIGVWFVSQQGDPGSSFLDHVMSYLSISSHLTLFIKGSLSTSSILFFLTATFFFLFLVFKSVELIRWRS